MPFIATGLSALATANGFTLWHYRTDDDRAAVLAVFDSISPPEVTLAARAPRKVGFGFRTATERVNVLVTRERVDVPSGIHVVDRGLALATHVLGREGFPSTPDVTHLVARPAPETCRPHWMSRGRAGRYRNSSSAMITASLQPVARGGSIVGPADRR